MDIAAYWNHFLSYKANSGLDFAQYGSYLYLLMLIVLLLPAVILGILGLRIKIYGLIASVGMSALLVSFSGVGFQYFLFFLTFEMVLIKLYSFIAHKTKNKYLYFIFLILSMSPLAIYKFAGLFNSHLFGFLGISYLSFKVIQIVVELYDGSIQKISLYKLFYFLTFFPTLSSGPIDRYRRFDEDISRKIKGKEYLCDYLPNGIRKIIMGIGYKFVLAYLINTFWLSTIPHDHFFLTILNYMYAYSFYLFFDFAGYSNFAVGTSLILGVKTPNNFFLPFISVNIKDFWTRWHISLSSWFTDYLYSRITMNILRRKLTKNRHKASYTAQIITMFTMGVWHGLQPFYLLYGLYHGLLLVLNDLYERKVPFYKKHKERFVYQLASVFVTFHLVCFGFLLFSGYLFQ